MAEQGVELDLLTQEKIKALYAEGRSKNYISNKLQLSRSTVKKYVEAEETELDELRQQKKREFIDEAWEDIRAAQYLGRQKIKLATVAAEGFQEKVDELVDLLKENEKTNGRDIVELIRALSSILNIPLSHVGTYLGIIYDKQALAAGEATSREEGNVEIVFNIPRPVQKEGERGENDGSGDAGEEKAD